MVPQVSQGCTDTRPMLSVPEAIQQLQEAFRKKKQGVYEGKASLYQGSTTMDYRRTKSRGGTQVQP